MTQSLLACGSAGSTHSSHHTALIIKLHFFFHTQAYPDLLMTQSLLACGSAGSTPSWMPPNVSADAAAAAMVRFCLHV